MTSGRKIALEAVLRPDASAIFTLIKLGNGPAMNFVGWMLRNQTNIMFDRTEGDGKTTARWYAQNPLNSDFSKLLAAIGLSRSVSSRC